MRNVVIIALQLLFLFTLCRSASYSVPYPTDDEDYSYESGSGYYEDEHVVEAFPTFLLCTEERLNELIANLPSECRDMSVDPMPFPLERVRILCECGEAGIKLVTECYDRDINDPFSAVCSPTVNELPCYSAFSDAMQEIFVNSDICSAEPDPKSLCPLSADCRNALHQAIENLGCCAYSNFVLSGMDISIADMLWETCEFPKSVAYVCGSSMDPGPTTSPDSIPIEMSLTASERNVEVHLTATTVHEFRVILRDANHRKKTQLFVGDSGSVLFTNLPLGTTCVRVVAKDPNGKRFLINWMEIEVE